MLTDDDAVYYRAIKPSFSSRTFPNSSKTLLLSLQFTGVGKSWLLLRWASEPGKFEKLMKSGQSMMTIGIDFKMKTVEIDGRRVKLQIVSRVLLSVSNCYFSSTSDSMCLICVLSPTTPPLSLFFRLFFLQFHFVSFVPPPPHTRAFFSFSFVFTSLSVGYRRAREVSNYHDVVLPKLSRHFAGIRHYKQVFFHEHTDVDQTGANCACTLFLCHLSKFESFLDILSLSLSTLSCCAHRFNNMPIPT